MLKTELLEIIANGENSGIEFISESLFFGKDFSGCPTQKSQKITRPLNCYASPSRPGPISSTTQHDDMDSSTLPRCHKMNQVN
jgi:hypothetical protein